MARHNALALLAIATVILAPLPLHAQKAAKKSTSKTAKKIVVAKVEGATIYRGYPKLGTPLRSARNTARFNVT